MSTEFWIGTAIAVFTLILGIGVTLAMDAKTQGEFRFAVGCFLVSAGIVVYGIFAWQATTGDTMRTRVVLSFLLFALSFMGIGEAIRWAYGRHTRSSVANGSGVGGELGQKPAEQPAEQPPSHPTTTVPPPGAVPGTASTQSPAKPRPLLSATIDQITGLIDAEKGRNFLVKMTLTNNGEESAASGFRLYIKKKGKTLLETNPTRITNFPLLGMVLHNEDNLPVKASAPIKRGVFCGGFLWYLAEKIPMEQAEHFQDAGVIWEIVFFDYQNHKYVVVHEFKEGENKQMAPFQVPPA